VILNRKGNAFRSLSCSVSPSRLIKALSDDSRANTDGNEKDNEISSLILARRYSAAYGFLKKEPMASLTFKEAISMLNNLDKIVLPDDDSLTTSFDDVAPEADFKSREIAEASAVHISYHLFLKL
jgi:hypothetical protein